MRFLPFWRGHTAGCGSIPECGTVRPEEEVVWAHAAMTGTVGTGEALVPA
ncbi:hypothetical protein V8Z69_16465 [Microbacterium aurugineum]|nr:MULTISPECIES: hypothetical protein [Microbacterium]MCE0509057.1 hypothetical protein [Microbacterium sp. KKR3/1]MCZ4300098.1 hypothetical protein [Microbacterium oxydans]